MTAPTSHQAQWRHDSVSVAIEWHNSIAAPVFHQPSSHIDHFCSLWVQCSVSRIHRIMTAVEARALAHKHKFHIINYVSHCNTICWINLFEQFYFSLQIFLNPSYEWVARVCAWTTIYGFYMYFFYHLRDTHASSHINLEHFNHFHVCKEAYIFILNIMSMDASVSPIARWPVAFASESFFIHYASYTLLFYIILYYYENANHSLRGSHTLSSLSQAKWHAANPSITIRI